MTFKVIQNSSTVLILKDDEKLLFLIALLATFGMIILSFYGYVSGDNGALYGGAVCFLLSLIGLSKVKRTYCEIDQKKQEMNLRQQGLWWAREKTVPFSEIDHILLREQKSNTDGNYYTYLIYFMHKDTSNTVLSDRLMRVKEAKDLLGEIRSKLPNEIQIKTPPALARRRTQGECNDTEV